MTMNRQHWWPNFFMSDNTIWLPRSPLPILKLRPHKYAGIIVFTINYKGRKQDASLYILLKRCSDGAGDLSLRYFMFYVRRVLESSTVSKEVLLFFFFPHPRNFCIKRRRASVSEHSQGRVEYIQLICLTFSERFTVMRARSRLSTAALSTGGQKQLQDVVKHFALNAAVTDINFQGRLQSSAGGKASL